MSSSSQYNPVLVALHWLMALGFIAMLTSGFILEYGSLEGPIKGQFYFLHKSGGFLLIIAFVLRVLTRALTHIPPMPQNFAKLEILAAKAGHFALYALMIALPMTGWVMVSTSTSSTGTSFFGLFEWPHLPGLTGEKDIGKTARAFHAYVAFGICGVLVAHIGAVIKHAIADHTNLLKRIWF